MIIQIIVALAIVVVMAALIAGLLGMLLDWSDTIVQIGMGVFLIGSLALLTALMMLIIFGGTSTSLKEGACYRAVRHTTTTFIPVGKVIVPSTTSGIDLEEIRCP